MVKKNPLRKLKKKVPKLKTDAVKSKPSTDKKIRRDDDDSQDGTEDSPDSDDDVQEEEEVVVPKKRKDSVKAPRSARTKSSGDKATKKMIKKLEPVSSGAGDLHSFDPFSQNVMRAQTPNPFTGGTGVAAGMGVGQPGWNNNNPFLSGNTGVPAVQPYQNIPFSSFGTANNLGSIGNVSGMGGVGGVSQVGNYGGVGGVGGGYGSYGVNPSFGSGVPYQDPSAGVGYQQQQAQLVVNPFVQQQPQQQFAVHTNPVSNPFAPISPQVGYPFAAQGNSQQYSNPF